MGDIVKKWHFRPLKEVVYSVYGEKRARQIEYKARKQRELSRSIYYSSS